MKKILLFLLLLLVITSCDFFPKKETGSLIAADFKTGTDGLTIETVEGLPPKEIYESNSFTIGLKISNKGGYDIERGEIKVAGFNEMFTGIENWERPLKSLQGRSITVPEGDFYIEEFRGENYGMPEGASELIEKYYVYADYDYETQANFDICINPNFYDLKSSPDSCQPTTSLTSPGQGAPIVITKVEQIVSPEGENQVRLQFKLTVENRGKGKVLSPVRIDEVKIANRRLQCTPRELDLEKNEREKKVVVCSGVETLRGAYTTTFAARLYYTYQTRMLGKLTVKSLKVS